MPWRVRVAASARSAIAALDPGLRLEFIERIAELSDEPIPHLVRPPDSQRLLGVLMFEYDSAVITELRVRVFFADIDLASRELLVLHIEHSMDGENDV